MKLMMQEEINKEFAKIEDKLSPEDIIRINTFFEKCNKELEEERKRPDYVPPSWSIKEMLKMCLKTLEELS